VLCLSAISQHRDKSGQPQHSVVQEHNTGPSALRSLLWAKCFHPQCFPLKVQGPSSLKTGVCFFVCREKDGEEGTDLGKGRRSVLSLPPDRLGIQDCCTESMSWEQPEINSDAYVKCICYCY